MSGKTEANLVKLSEFEHMLADGDEDAFYAFDEWLAGLSEDEIAALRLDHYHEPVKTPDGAWVERCWHLGCLSALIAPPAPRPDGFDAGRSAAAEAAAAASDWIYTASGRMFCPAHARDWQLPTPSRSSTTPILTIEKMLADGLRLLRRPGPAALVGLPALPGSGGPCTGQSEIAGGHPALASLSSLVDNRQTDGANGSVNRSGPVPSAICP